MYIIFILYIIIIIYLLYILYYGLRFSYDTYNFISYIYSFIPNKNNIPQINMELYEIEYKNDLNILKIY